MHPDPETSPAFSKLSRSLGPALDALVGVLILIWLNHGLVHGGRRILTHGADLRRTAMILAVAAALAIPATRKTSMVLRGAISVSRFWLRARWRWLTLAFVTGAAIAVGVEQALALRFPLWDVGIFHQILWSLAHGLGFHSTISGAGNFLLDHYSPALALLVPAFWISGDSPLTLPVVYPLLIFGGVAAWVFLAERMPGVNAEFRRELAAATLLFGVSFDSLWGNLAWGFHETGIAFFALSWALALLVADAPAGRTLGGARSIGAALLVLVAAVSKETVLPAGAVVFALWSLREFRSRRWLAVGALLALALLLASAFYRFETIPHPEGKNYFERYYAYMASDGDSSPGLGSFVLTLLFRPWVVVQAVGAREMLRFLWTVLGPWLGAPLLWVGLLACRRFDGAGKGWPWLLPAVPSFLASWVATYPALRGAGFHYVLELWPFLLVVTLLAWTGLRSPRVVWAWALLALLAMDHDPLNEFREYRAEARVEARARAMLQAIPAADSLAAETLAGTWVSGRPLVTQWPDMRPFNGRCPKWVALRGVGRGLEHELSTWNDLVICLKDAALRDPSNRADRRVGSWSLYRTYIPD